MTVTLEDIFKLFSESEKKRLESDAAFEKRMEKLREESEKRMEKLREESEKKRLESDAAFEKRMEQLREESEKKRLESDAAFEKKMEKQRLDNERFVKQLSRDLNKKIGSLTDILGLYAQAQTQERIIDMFSERGIELRSISSNYKEEDGNRNVIHEIDILLYNTIYAIIVEVKNHLKKDDVDEHLERMEKCTIFPPRGTEGKVLLGAVATMVISREVETYAKKKGLFVIKPSGKSVKIGNAVDFKPKEWQVKA
jgi:hypothetical protein